MVTKRGCGKIALLNILFIFLVPSRNLFMKKKCINEHLWKGHGPVNLSDQRRKESDLLILLCSFWSFPNSPCNYFQPGYSLRTFTGHSAGVMSLDFHPNKEDLICSCDGDGEIRCWSINNGSCTRVFKVKLFIYYYINMHIGTGDWGHWCSIIWSSISS